MTRHEDIELKEEIRAGMARSLWMSAFIDYAEQNRDDPEIPRAKGGEDWSDYVPFLEPVDGADDPSHLAADDLTKLYASENGVSSIMDLYERATAAMKAAGMEIEDELQTCADFGFALAQMAVGSGVSWFDDHPKFPLKRPFFEVSYDGDELVWSGGSAATRVNPKDPDDVAHTKSIAEVRQILARIPKSWRCSKGCPGWIVSESDQYGTQIEVCDECMSALPKHLRLSDADVRQLPEAQERLAEVIEARKEAGAEEMDFGENPAQRWLVLRVDMDASDTYAVAFDGDENNASDIQEAIEEAIEIALPNDGDHLEYAIVTASDGGAARIKRAKFQSYGRYMPNPGIEGWSKPRVAKGWPETWEKKIGHWWYTVEKAQHEGWHLGWSHRHADPDAVDRGARFPTKEAAMKFAHEHAGVTA